jgi:hypothetical protein
VGKVICEFAHSTVPTFHSGYEAYDKLSPAYQKFIEGLTAVYDARGLREEVMYFSRLVDHHRPHEHFQVGEEAEQCILRSSRRT